MIEECIHGDPNDNMGYLMWRIFKYWQRGKQRVLEEFGITASQLEVMGAIYKMTFFDKETTQIALSQETDIDPMTISTILRNLEKKELIKRTESKTDTRARVVKLTESGDKLFTLAMAKVNEKQINLFRNIDEVALRTQLQILLKELSDTYKASTDNINK